MMPDAMLAAMPIAFDELRCVEAQRGAHARGRGDRAEHRRRMESRLVHALGRHVAQAAHDLAADRDAEPDIVAGQPMLLGGRENGGHDDGAGMHRSAFVGVVEVVAVGRGAVAQRRHPRTAAAGVADRRAVAGLVGGRERGPHVVARARREAKAGDVDQQRVADRLRGRRRGPRQRGDDRGDLLGDRGRVALRRVGRLMACRLDACRTRRPRELAPQRVAW